ncbi:major facilitator superfamily domain-containing protein [Pavlovales sp. CCMP2436]|nr:major facilitator superfamily domain-containing protein [Pavlovales sp. CCMP2436]
MGAAVSRALGRAPISATSLGKAADEQPAAVPFLVMLTLALLSSVGPITMELYTPSLPAMAIYFDSSVSEMSSTITTMLFAFAGAQLLAGSLSDSIGRKPVLVVGMAFYTLASVSGGLAMSIYQLQLQRAVQGCGSALAMVTGQALVRDLFPDLRARERVTGRLASVRSCAPLLAPILGSWFQIWFGWRAAFVVFAAFGLAALAATRTIPFQPKPARADGVPASYWVNLWQTLKILLRDRKWLGITGADNFSFVAFLVYVTSSSFVLQMHYKVPLSQFGLVYGVNAIGLLIGTESSSRLSKCLEGANAAVLRLGLAVSLAASIVQLLLVLTPGICESFWALVLPAAFVQAGRGLSTVQAITLSLEDYPHLAGTATGLNFAIRASLAGLAVWGIGLVYDHQSPPIDIDAATGLAVELGGAAGHSLSASPVPLSILCLASVCIANLIYWVLGNRAGSARDAGSDQGAREGRSNGMAALDSVADEEAPGPEKDATGASPGPVRAVVASWAELGEPTADLHTAKAVGPPTHVH